MTIRRRNDTPPAHLPVAIIGGGYAGMAAAVELARRNIAVQVFERSATLGGRARVVHSDGFTIDNGQHLLLGAYSGLSKMLRFLQVSSRQLAHLPLTLHSTDGLDFRAAQLPAPWHLLVGLLRARGLDGRQRRAIMRLLWKIRRRDDSLTEARTVDELLALTAQPEALRVRIWRPLCIAALNTAPAEACARTFVNVLRDTFIAPAPASEMLVPRCDLSELFPVPAARFLATHQGQVHTQATVRGVALQPDGSFLLSGRGLPNTAARALIIATAPFHATELLHSLGEAFAPLATQLAELPQRAISTTYFAPGADWRLPQPITSLRDAPAQWVFDRAAFNDPARLWAAVASDVDPAASASTRETAIWQQLQRELGQTLSAPAWSKTITERRATIACLPNVRRPEAHTAHERVVLAGDYLASPYPATIESAVRSGVNAAHILLTAMP